MVQLLPAYPAHFVAAPVLMPMRLANTAGGTVAARWSMAELRLVRVVMPSLLSRPIIEVGFWWWPAHLPGNSQRWSARVLAAPNGFAIGSDVTSASRGGGSRSGSAPSRR